MRSVQYFLLCLSVKYVWQIFHKMEFLVAIICRDLKLLKKQGGTEKPLE